MLSTLTRPAVLLRLEGALLFALCTLFYARADASWWLFALLFFSPDLAMLGYLASPRIGALCYNLAHTEALPAALLGYGLLNAQPLLVALALIWLGHIGFDRLVGYGLKYTSAFQDTHLGRV